MIGIPQKLSIFSPNVYSTVKKKKNLRYTLKTDPLSNQKQKNGDACLQTTAHLSKENKPNEPTPQFTLADLSLSLTDSSDSESTNSLQPFQAIMDKKNDFDMESPKMSSPPATTPFFKFNPEKKNDRCYITLPHNCTPACQNVDITPTLNRLNVSPTKTPMLKRRPSPLDLSNGSDEMEATPTFDRLHISPAKTPYLRSHAKHSQSERFCYYLEDEDSDDEEGYDLERRITYLPPSFSGALDSPDASPFQVATRNFEAIDMLQDEDEDVTIISHFPASRKMGLTPSKKKSSASSHRLTLSPSKRLAATPSKHNTATPSKKKKMNNTGMTPSKKKMSATATHSHRLTLSPSKRLTATPSKRLIATPSKHLADTPSKHNTVTPSKKKRMHNTGMTPSKKKMSSTATPSHSLMDTPSMRHTLMTPSHRLVAITPSSKRFSIMTPSSKKQIGDENMPSGTLKKIKTFDLPETPTLGPISSLSRQLLAKQKH